MDATTISALLVRVRGEFMEMPGLKLTLAQAQRLWGVDRETCESLLRTLVLGRFLISTRDGCFVRDEVGT